MKKGMLFKGLISSSLLVCALFLTMTNADAAKGNWTSAKATDLNGLSEVWTSYSGGRQSAEVVDLYVKYSRDHSTVGYKSVGCKVNQKVSHMCWGAINRDKYGQVKINASCWHSPGFDE